MSSALKNFTITFAIALVLFLVLGLGVLGPYLVKQFDMNDMGDKQEESSDISTDASDNSGTTSEDTSAGTDNKDYDENGKIFTAVVVSVDEDKRPVNIAFIDANGKTKQYIYCTIDAKTKVSNEIGNVVPLEVLLRGKTPDEITRCITAITGIETEYCLIFNKSSLDTITGQIPRANVELPNNQVITITNPKYENYVAQPNVPYPEDYTITISNGDDGTVHLRDFPANDTDGKTYLQWLLEYNPTPDGSVYNVIYKSICSSLLKQFLQSESASMARILSVCESNIKLNEADGYLETIYSYNEWNQVHYQYPRNRDNVAEWEKAIKDLREYDGTYNIVD